MGRAGHLGQGRRPPPEGSVLLLGKTVPAAPVAAVAVLVCIAATQRAGRERRAR
ncbi:hypothetical protein ACFYY1_21680 [Streptomyces sp. NPDC001890]|uniref:hypothetical protein n=1 Tax=Streptomyces sp. NPDC001890 TaxID=3364620 RepID=UPI0036A43011